MRTEEEIRMKIDELNDSIEETGGMQGNTIIVRMALSWAVDDTDELDIL